MTDYDNLINRLKRYSKQCLAHELDADFAEAVQQAADAIEELVKNYECALAQMQYWTDETLDRDVELINLKNKLPKWIPVAERLPEEETNVLVVRRFLGSKGVKVYVDLAERIGEDWVSYSDEYKLDSNKHTTTHWMKLPEPPKEET